MSRHRSRLSRLGRTSATTPPPAEAVSDAHDRILARITARLHREAGRELTDDQAALLDDQALEAADRETIGRDLRAQGIDPSRDADERRARLRDRLNREAARTA